MCCLSEDWERIERRLVRDVLRHAPLRRRCPDEPVEFNLPYGEWIRLFREHGFRVEALVEVRPPAGAETTYRTPRRPSGRASWPMEEIWRCRKT